MSSVIVVTYLKKTCTMNNINSPSIYITFSMSASYAALYRYLDIFLYFLGLQREKLLFDY